MSEALELKSYKSPETDTSVYKGIPVNFRTQVREEMRKMGYTGSQIRFEYRGKREHKVLLLRNGGTYKQYDPSCRLRNAKTFAVYLRNSVR